VQKAVDSLQKSLDKCQPGGNAAHEHMRACIQLYCQVRHGAEADCPRAKDCELGYRIRLSFRPTSRVHTPRANFCKASAPRAHAAATKNPFSILHEGTDDGERTDDE
jgi:hypothetical protein